MNPYLDLYNEMLAHQREHSPYKSFPREGPELVCSGCARTADSSYFDERFDLKRKYAWAVPDDAALDVIAKHSPAGVVEIGAGGGYWAKMLRDRGVDVVAYDPDPRAENSKWASGTPWTEVLVGDHTAVIGHPERTLLTVWPSYSEPWTSDMLDLYAGQTVIYVGEGSSGCTGDERFHALLGDGYCWHDDGEDCDCCKDGPSYREVESVDIPQWWGLHDRLRVYERVPVIQKADAL